MDGFNEQLQTLDALGAKVIAATAESLEKAQEVAANIDFPVAYGVTREQVDQVGAWWEDRRQIIHATSFVLNGSGKVLSATYSTGPIGRVEGIDAVRYIEFQEKQKKA